MDSTEDNGNDAPRLYARKSYALHGKIMLTVVLTLFTVVILVVCLHIYARQYHRQARRRHRLRRRRRRRTQINIYSDTTASANTVHGLDASVLKSLPIFIYSSTAQDEVGECAVCLSEFEENEKGRLLPKCSHSFHIDCIDMWFHSHSTCPLCRVPVSREIQAPATETPVEVAVVGEVAEPEAETSSGVCPSGGNNEGKMGCSSASSSAFGVEHIEVPRRNDSFRGLEEEEEETGLASPGGQGFKSPGGRIRSLKRMLTRDRKAPFPPLGCSPAAEIDLEKAEEAPTDDPSNVKR